jgi:hypothetical protein
MSIEIIKSNINLDCKRKIAYTFSELDPAQHPVLVVRDLIMGSTSPADPSFRSFAVAAAIDKIKDGLRLGIENVSVQSMGDAKDNEFLIRMTRWKPA